MNIQTPGRLPRRLWLTALVLWVVIVLFPVSTRLSRWTGVILLIVIWFGLIGLCWRRRALRFFLLGCTFLLVVFSILPARTPPNTDSLRSDYVIGLRRYEDVTYHWGGESPKGIDCSGLIRRGLIDALFLRGFCSLDPGLIRESLKLWWHDCTAKDLGEGTNQLTTPLFETRSLQKLDHTLLLPGDLAVTRDGIHILAYLGNKQWIEADPAEERVIILTVGTENNSWLDARMKLVRWRLLE